MRRSALGAASFMAVLAGVCAGCAQSAIVARYWSEAPRSWPTDAPSTCAQYPELNVPDTATLGEPGYFPVIRKLRGRDIGLAFSGGGARAATAASAQLEAFHSQGWMSQVKYISAVSGGAWASIMYTYSPSLSEDVTDPAATDRQKTDLLLGAYIPPAELTEEALTLGCAGGKEACKGDNGGKSVGIIARIMNYFGIIWGKSGRFQNVFREESYTRAVGYTILSPLDLSRVRSYLNIDGWQCSDEGRAAHASHHPGTSNPVCVTSGPYGFANHRVRSERPFLIVSATMLFRPTLYPGWGRRDIYPVEITPLYAGIGCEAVLTDRAGSEKTHSIGGGFVETFAFTAHLDTFTREKGAAFGVAAGALGTKDSMVPREVFNLVDIAGTAGSAPVDSIAEFMPPAKLGYPQYLYTPPDKPQHQHDYQFGDGAHLDNLGVLPLLARGVKTIYAFINTPIPVDSDEPLDDLRALWGELPDKRHLRVFRHEHELQELLDELRVADREGQPAFYCGDFTLVAAADDHDPFQVANRTGGYTPHICWVYLNRPAGWLHELKASTSCDEGDDECTCGLRVQTHRNLTRGTGSFERFPNFGTIDDLTLRQIVALRSVAGWSVRQFKAELDEAGAAGGAR